MNKESLKPLAENLAAGYLAYVMGHRLIAAGKKRLVKEWNTIPLGRLWYDVAELIVEEMKGKKG
jgi:hypothetical protein